MMNCFVQLMPTAIFERNKKRSDAVGPRLGASIALAPPLGITNVSFFV
jgi:hypothetical protein